MAQSFDIPVDVPWQLVAASPDMMDTTFNDDLGYPPAWHSSLAIYAYEPSPDDLPAELCNQTITYLKVTCSITGYQPSQAQSSDGGFGTPPYANPQPVTVDLPTSPSGGTSDPVFGMFTDPEMFTTPYFGCYGVLLNVAVFPSVTTLPEATPTSEVEFQFSSPATPAPLPNGLAFTMYEGDVALSSLPPLFPSRGKQHFYELPIASDMVLEIDLPYSTNVELLFGAADSSAVATITAYTFGTQVFQSTLPANGALGSTLSCPLGSVSVTKIMISTTYPRSFLVGISYSPLERAVTTADYPHIIDFEPKTRDLYQAATDQNEVLTGSNSSVNTGKSMSNTSSSQMGLGLTGGYSSGSGGGPNLAASLTGQWGNTSNDTSSTQIDESRQMRETQGSTTNITQQYNLLTGYHAGTNRATFLMLPRPHTLQPTDYRTFVRGLRIIEGIQEFFLIVSRPNALPGICIEATLETGHFAENVQVQAAIEPTQVIAYPIPIHQSGSNANANYSNQGGPPEWASPWTYQISIPNGWQLDTSQGGDNPTVQDPPPGWPISGRSSIPNLALCPGISCVISPMAFPGAATHDTNSWYLQGLSSLNQGGPAFVTPASADGTTFTFNAVISSNPASPVNPYNPLQGNYQTPGAETGCDAALVLNFTFHLVQSAPADTSDAEPSVVISDFLVTSRDLCACIFSCQSDNCVMVGPTQQLPYSESPGATAPSVPGTSSAPSTGQTPSPAAIGVVPVPVSTGQAPSASPTGKAAAAVSSPAVAKKLPQSPKAGTAAAGTTPGGTKAPKKMVSRAQDSIVYETKLKLPTRLLHPSQLQKSRTPAARELMNQIQYHMLSNWRSPERRPRGTVGFLESDYFCERALNRLPKDYLAVRISDIKSLSPATVKILGAKSTIGDVLQLNLHQLRLHAKAGIEDAVRIRRVLLGFTDRSERASDSQASKATEKAKPSPKGPVKVAAKMERISQKGRNTGKRKAAKKK
jgi:hypothetical protein